MGFRGGSRISGNGVHMYKGVVLSHFSKISHLKMKSKLFHFHRIFKNWGGEEGGDGWGSSKPLWIHNWASIHKVLSVHI